MSGKYDYQKDLKHSALDGGFKALCLLGAELLLKGTRPTFYTAFMNWLKKAIIIGGADIGYDYAIAHKWFSPP